MLDSLKATVIVSEPVSAISANAELELPDEDPEPPRLPAVELPPANPEPLDEEDPEEDEPLDALEVEPPDTLSPGEALDNDTIVPLVGA